MSTAGSTSQPAADAAAAARRLTRISIDLAAEPDLRFRVDSFRVPDAAREEFAAAMHRNLAFIETLAGFRGHVVLEKAGGPTAFNVATIAVWASGEALEAAAAAVRAYYQETGFDPAVFMSGLGIEAALGNYRAPAEAQ